MGGNENSGAAGGKPCEVPHSKKDSAAENGEVPITVTERKGRRPVSAGVTETET
ncbi:unnamed protein product, partial [Nesidiocoris tenuis]